MRVERTECSGWRADVLHLNTSALLVRARSSMLAGNVEGDGVVRAELLHDLVIVFEGNAVEH